MTNSLWRKRQEPEALKLALEAYLCREMPAGTVIGDPKWWVPKIANAIKEALAQPEQEPVAWKLVPIDPTDEMLKAMDECSTEGYDERLYAGHAASVYMAAVDVAPTPPQRTWVGLTPQERDEINEQVYGAVPHHVAFHHAIEAKLKEKNT